MPITTTYDPATAIRSHVVTGVVTFDDFVGELQRIYAAADLPTQANVVWDLLGADVAGVASSEVAQLARFVKDAWQQQSGFRAAFVVSPGVTFGLTRMYEQLLDMFDEDDIRLFPTAEAAFTWISAERG